MPMNPRLLRPTASGFNPRQISGLALWLDAADSQTLYTTDAGPVAAVSSPLDISGCLCWYDASDASTITQSSGAVSAWADKSGNGYTLRQSTEASRPTTGTRTLGGKNVLDFDGTNDVLSLGSSPPEYLLDLAASRALTVFAVTASDSPNSIRRLLSLQRTGKNSNDSGFFLARHTSTPGTVEVAVGGGDSATNDQLDRNHIPGFADNSSAAAIYAATVSAAGNAATIRKDGASQSLTVRYGTMQPSNFLAFGSGNHTLDIGTSRSTSGVDNVYWDGLVAEVIVYPSALSTTDRARVEAYLAAKWGISGVHAPATTASQPVGYWADKSGNGRHATQGTAAARPAISVAALNGRNVVLASSADRSLRTAAFQAGLPQTVFVVASLTSPGGSNSGIFQRGALNTIHSLWDNAGTIRARRGTAADASAAARTGYVAYSCVFTKTLSRLFVNGAQANDNTADVTGGVADSTDNRTLALFNLDSTLGMAGGIAEFLYFNGVLPTSERQRIERYLAAKWGITLAPQVSNADAQDWVNRVYANGGTVSTSTANAVNSFCDAIDAAGIRDRFYRLNLFAGTGLNAALVPLYRGPTGTGTQYGNATDTNVGPFVSGDYGENNGLQATADGSQSATKYLNTGFAYATLPSYLDAHMAADYKTIPGSSISSGQWIMGGLVDPAAGSPQTNQYRVLVTTPTSSGYNESTVLGSTTEATRANQTIGTRCHTIITRSSATSLTNYRDGGSAVTNAASISTAIGVNASCQLRPFAIDNSGFGSASYRHILSLYSIGLSLTATQAADYFSAVSSLRTALGRA